MFHKILVAVDEFSLEDTIFRSALNLAKTMGSRLLLVHVLCPADKDYPGGVIYPTVNAYYPTLQHEVIQCWQEKLAQYEQHQQDALRSLAFEAEAIGVTSEIAFNMGDPGRMICAMARNWEADLIVVGRRGRSGMSELLLGSVSNYVMHHAPCSVLTVQGTQSDAKAAPNH